MKRLYVLFILFMVSSSNGFCQDFDITLNTAESGTKTHQARNSITFGPNYSYTPSGGTMTAEIVNPVIGGLVSYSSTVDPMNRSLNTSYLVGATKGAFNVNLIGGASYTIPFEVPPGVGGFAPSLSLSYSSNAGPEIAGYGWNLAGLSAITRSPKNQYLDGETVGVDLTSTDRFSLDGQRLICVSGTYGANNSEYRTEIDNFTKITCLTDGTSTPKRFLVKTKGGTTIEYGYEGDSDQTIDGLTEEISWYIDKMTDLYGNTIEFEYIKQNGHNYIGEIKYGANTITFYYKERNDKQTSYFAGGILEQNLILDKIEMKYNSTLVKKYELKYNYHYTSPYYSSNSVLNEVIEYGIGGSRYNSTAFSYEYPTDDCNSYPYMEYNSYISTNYTQYSGDFNGDGRSDIYTLNKSNQKDWRLYLATDYGGFTLSASGSHNYTVDNVIASDLNADGKDDLILVDFSISQVAYLWSLSSGTSFATAYLASIEHTDIRPFYDEQDYSADFDGDGVNDCLVKRRYNGTSNWDVYSMGHNGSLNSNLTRKFYGTLTTWGEQDYVADFNGDGKTDIWIFDTNGIKIYTVNGNSLTTLYSSTYPTSNHHFKMGDFNGDGKTDIFVYGYSSYNWSKWQFRLSTGTGFKINRFTGKKSNLNNDKVYTGDFNGDGRTDILALSKNTSNNPRQYYFVTKPNATDMSSEYYERSEYNKDRDFTLGDFDGNGQTDILVTKSSNQYYRGILNDKTNILLSKIANGLNNTTTINYCKLNDQYSNYTKGTGASFPVMDFQGPLQVVKSVLSDNGRGSQNTTTYKFEGAKIHRQGKGFLCMTKQTVTDVANSTSTETNFEYHNSKYFPKLTSTVNKAGTTTLSTVSNTWLYNTTATGVIFPYISSSTQSNSLTGHSVTTSLTYDSYGNPTEIEKSFNNGVTETTTNVFSNNATSWLLGKATSSTTDYEKSGESTISNTVTYTYSTDGILKPDFIKYHENTNWYYTKNHDYDSHGNLTQLYEQGSGVSSKQTNYTYETNEIRTKTVTDPLGHETEMFYDTYGRLSSEEDYLNNTTSYGYDNMGRTTTKTEADGFVTTTSYHWGLTGGPSYAAFYMQQSGNNGSVTKVWHDKLGREIRSDVKGFNGSYIYTATEFNTKGQLYRVSEPGTSTTPSQWNTHAYDSYGRITGITRPSGKNTTYAYSSNRVTETAGGKTSWKETDSQGLLTKAHDNGGDVVYTYYPNGKPKTITAPGNVVTSMEYDVAGNQTKLIDPSAGTTTYTYDAFGRLKSQKNGRNQTTTFSYNSNNLLSSKSTPEGTTTYSYNSNKQLTGIASPGSVSRSYGYDSKDRVNSISESIVGTNFTTTFTFDNKGRLSTRTHPSGIVETNNYNSNGYLSSISAGGSTRWTVTAMNARQQITAATYGNSLYATFGFDSYGYPTYSKAQAGGTYKQDYRYSFTASTGNLYSRQNYLRSKTETFTYDNLDRLIGVTGPENLTMAYANNGNILTKSDLSPGSYTYGHSTKPYAVTEINSSNLVIPSATQSATYTSFEQVKTIDENFYHADFTYNADNQRCKMEVKHSGSTILTRWYVGSRYIKETEGSTTKEFTWIGGDAYTAPVVAEKVGSTTNYYYLLRDYLGNITHKVNTSNTVVAEYSFDAWGRRRDKDDWHYTLSGEPDLLAGRGFTSHEYLPWFNIVNMNGRLYDPLVGRFLSPDENVQLPDFTQNFNRYSYGLNNPMVYTDPDGEIIFTILAAIFAPPLLPVAIAADIGGIINTVNHWDAIKNSDNFWQGFAKGAGLYGLGGANGALTYTSAGIGTFAGGFIEELGSGLITGETDDLLAKSFVSGGTQYLGGKIAIKVSGVTSKGLTKLGLENRLAKNIISDVAGAVPGTFTATTAKSYLGYGKSFKESIQDGVRSIPGATLSGIGSGITKTLLTNQRAARVEKIRQNPDLIDPYYDFQWQPSNNQYYQPLTPKVPIYTPSTSPSFNLYKFIYPELYAPWEY